VKYAEEFSQVLPPTNEEAAEYEKFIDLVNDTFASHAKEDEDFEVHVEGGSVCDAQLFIHNYAALPADTVRGLAVRIRAELGKFWHYWRLRVFVYRRDEAGGQSDAVLWLEVDRYVIFQYLGQVSSERFSDIGELDRCYWGN
jgi:hypothetical protein